MKRLVVFSNDAILSYYKKQEIKPRYFNPGNFFDEVHIISFAKKEVEEEKVSVLAGSARLKIHSIDNPFSLKSFFLFFLKREKIIELLRQINPDTIRAYNSQLAGYLAAYAGKRLRVPSVLSLHTNLDECRDHKSCQFRRGLHLFISKFFFEPYALSYVDKTICASHFLEAYARKYGARDLKVIYNKVYTQDYKTSEDSKEKKRPLKILTVGRLDPPKNQECIIKAIKDLDVELTLIGDGRNYKSLSNLVRELKIDHKVRFIRSVPNQEICKLYKKSDIFAISSFYEGFCIPVLEAMAASLP
ncbi:MAG: glycosyltransferase, partial [Candidatus Pacebacteria bacterium]|nr:glycosyltransferase [Candidatus Paceibacterota bacterium]